MRRRRIWIAAVSLMALGVIVWVALPSEPKADGQPISHWVKQREVEWKEDSQPHLDATAAIRKIGTNALPWLLTEIRQKDSALKLKWFELIRNKPSLHSWVLPAQERQNRAVEGYGALKALAAPAAPELVRLLESDEDGQFSAVSKALAHIGAPAVSLLTNALQHPDPWVRCNIAGTLERFGEVGQPAIPALLERLRDTDTDVRAACASALGCLEGDPKLIVPALLPLLGDPSPEVREETADTLGGFGAEADVAVEPLLRLLNDHESAGDAISALGAIGRRGERVVPLLLAGLEKTNASLRSDIIRCLGSFPAEHEVIVPVLLHAAETSDRETRTRAMYSLGKLQSQPDRVIPFLIQQMEHPDARVRYAAAGGVSEYGKRASAAIPALKKLQKDQTDISSGCFVLRVCDAAERAIEQIQPALSMAEPATAK